MTPVETELLNELLNDASPSHCSNDPNASESGIALLLAILMLLMVSAIGISALNRAEDESFVSGASRRQVTNVAAAEAALKLVGAQLQTAQAGSAPPSTPISVSAFTTEISGMPIALRSGVIGDPTAHQITPIGTASVSGGDLRVGYGAAPRLIYRINVVASDPTGGSVQLQAQYAVRQN